MTRARALILATALVVAVAVLPTAPANAATSAAYGNEIGGTGVAARSNTEALRTAWTTDLTSKGASAPSPFILAGGVLNGVIATATDGTTISVARTRYTTGSNPTYVAPSPNSGTGACTANGSGTANAGAGLQGGAPRPTSLIGGSASCPNGFAYTESGGVGENTTRDAVDFTFSRAVLGFGAWFGDLETRTDGSGVAAVVRLYGVGNVLLSDQQVTPGPNYLPQSNCGGSYTGCGNNTTRWIGFVADPAQPVTRMVVIVGDDDAVGDGTDEGIGFIGPSLALDTAGITLTKTASDPIDSDADGMIGPGDTIPYSLALHNTGTLAVTGATISDPTAVVTCPDTSVAAGATMTCTGSYEITQADADAGEVVNTATATATSFGGQITSAPSTVTTTIVPVTSLDMQVTADAATFAAVGTTITYTVNVSNLGNRTLHDLDIAGAAPGAGTFATTCDAVVATLAAGQSVTCQSTYTTTQADLDGGGVGYTASAEAVSPSGGTVGPQVDTAFVAAQQIGSLTVVKSADPQTFGTVGEQILFAIVASNSGNVTLTDVAISDPAPGDGAFTTDCGEVDATLQPGEEVSCSASYTVTQLDIDNGGLTNTAEGVATAPGGDEVTATPASVTVSAVTVDDGGLQLVKTVDEPTYSNVGDILHYSFAVTNLGAVTLNTVQVADDAPGAGDFTSDCATVTLAPDATSTCTAEYTVTQDDLDAGSLSNTATATARTPQNALVESNPSTADSTVVSAASLLLEKTAAETSFAAVGDVIHYTIDVTNAGNLTLHAVTITDAAPGAGAFETDCDSAPTELAPGASTTCTASYTVTQSDLDTGGIQNIASATALAPDDAPVNASDATADTPASQTYSVSLVKTADVASVDAVGDEIRYLIVLTNDGNVTMTAAEIVEDAPGDGAFATDCTVVDADLAPGASTDCTAVYRVTQADLDAGSVTNAVSASALDPQGNIRNSNPATATVLVDQNPAFTFAKTALETDFTEDGKPITFRMTLTNIGNITLTSITIADSAPGGGAFSTDCGDVFATVAPGGSVACTALYKPDSVDFLEGRVANAASAVAVAGAAEVPLDPIISTAVVARGAEHLAVSGGSAPPVAAGLGALLGGALLLLIAKRRLGSRG